jgi:cytoskeletal protein RodZ
MAHARCYQESDHVKKGLRDVYCGCYIRNYNAFLMLHSAVLMAWHKYVGTVLFGK